MQPEKTPKRSLRERLKPPVFSRTVRWVLTAGLLLLATVGLAALLMMIGTQDFSRGRFSSYFHYPSLLFLNYLPVALLMALVYFATNRAWLAYLIPSVLLVLMDFVSYYKVVLRGDPLVAEDFTTIAEGAGMLGQYTFHLPAWLYISVALIVVGTLVLHRYARGRVPKRIWWVRLVAIVLILAMCLGAWSLWYSDLDRYELTQNTDLFNVWKDAESYASRGFLYSFLNSIAKAIPHAPEGYSEAAAKERLGAFTEADIPAEQKVNVVVTMLESYSDLSVFDSIRFTNDAYAHWHELQAESYCGTLISDTLGGGTINAERAFLTGFTYPQPNYRRATDSFVRYFRQQGYFTDGAHPGNDWFYNRDHVNARLGFDRYYFIEGHYEDMLTEAHSLDGHPDDALFFEERAQIYASRDKSQPYFSFSVSYQGHSPYVEDRLIGGEYVSHEGISDGAYYTVNNYLSGVADTGAQLAAYVDTFRDDKEPVVLVFFGDHKPTLGVGNCYYTEMGVNAMEGTAQGLYNLYSTPYLIWANDAAKEILGDGFTGEGPIISPCYLMSVLFDCCGWEGTQWMQLQRQTRAVVPVMQSRGIYLVAGDAAKEISREYQPLEDLAFTYQLPAAAQEAESNYSIAEHYLRQKRVK